MEVSLFSPTEDYKFPDQWRDTLVSYVSTKGDFDPTRPTAVLHPPNPVFLRPK